MQALPRRGFAGITAPMKIALVICALALLAGCTTGSKVTFNQGPASVQTASRSEPIFYNGKTYQLDYNFIEGQGAFDMKVSGLSPKQQQDAVNIATSGLSYFACPDGQRGKLIGMPIYVSKKWTAYAKCG
jgi:type IV pilus biogenesis protein CpaD/CtpE